MERFRRLGHQLDAAWSRHNYDEATFPALATEALERARLHEAFSPDDLLRDLLLHDPGFTQNDGTFGEPPVVVWRSRGFYIEILYWLDSTTDIHSHAFSGAFQVLWGGSIHTTWQFRRETRVRSTLHVGEVSVRDVEALHRGDVRPIVAGERFIHALFHLPRPSVSLVVRTLREDDHLPQLNYLPPGVAWDPHEQDRLRDRRSQALRLLAETDPAAHHAAMEELARRADLPTWFHALRHFTSRVPDERALVHYTHLARALHGELAERVGAAMLEYLRQLHIIRRREVITDPHQRWLLALMLNVPSRAEILRLIAASGHADPVATLLAGLRAMARAHDKRTTTLLDLQVGHDEGGFERVVAILLAVMEGLLRDTTLERIAARASDSVGGLAQPERDGIPDLIQDLTRPASPFVALFR